MGDLTTQDLNEAYKGVMPIAIGVSVLVTMLIVTTLSPPKAEELSCASRLETLSQHQRMLLGAEGSAQEWCDEHLTRADDLLKWGKTLPNSAPYSVTDLTDMGDDQ